MSAKIEPCPFCGTTAVISVMTSGVIECGQCKARGPNQNSAVPPIAAWNKRAADTPSSMGKRGGKKGGLARAAKLSAKRRSQIAKKAAKARWAKARALAE